MLRKFDDLPEAAAQPWRLADILPGCLPAGRCAGHLTAEGALLLDPSGQLESGIPLCPPEGDAGTGMTATDAVRVRTGNVSAGTSIFGMIVLEKELAAVYPEIDIVTTPAGDPVGMAHCNTCTSDLDAWVHLFEEFCRAAGKPMDRGELYSVLYNAALAGDPDGGVLAYNCFAGEPVVGLADGRPLLVRSPGARFSLGNFMRANLIAALAVLKAGMELLLKKEGVHVENMMGHGGFFKTAGVGHGPARGLHGIGRGEKPCGLAGCGGLRLGGKQYTAAGSGGRGGLRPLYGALPRGACVERAAAEVL